MLLESINKTYHNHNEDIQALNNINLYIQEKGMIFIVGQWMWKNIVTSYYIW